MSERAFQICRLGPSDAGSMQALCSMFAEAFEDPETYGAARPSQDYHTGLLVEPGFVALVALEEAQVIGGLVAYELRKFEQERSELYIYDLAVAVSHRRRGVATGLIDALKPIARSRGAWVIYVQADLEDAPAVALYTKLGRREDVLHFDIAVS